MHCNPAIRPGFNLASTSLMVLGFIFFWPIGLAILAYNLWGHRFRAFAEGIRSGFERSGFRDFAPAGFDRGSGFRSQSGNVAFDDYRERELERLKAERRRLEEERHEFEEFVRNLRRAKDQEEFDRFMAERRNRPTGPTQV